MVVPPHSQYWPWRTDGTGRPSLDWSRPVLPGVEWIFREGCDVRAVDRIYLSFASYPAREGLAYPGTTTTQPGLESFGESKHISYGPAVLPPPCKRYPLLWGLLEKKKGMGLLPFCTAAVGIASSAGAVALGSWHEPCTTSGTTLVGPSRVTSHESLFM